MKRYAVGGPLDPQLVTEAETLEKAFENAADAAQALRESRAKLFRQYHVACSGHLGRRRFADVACQIIQNLTLHFFNFGAIAARHAGKQFCPRCRAHLGQQILEMRDARPSGFQFLVIGVKRDDATALDLRRALPSLLAILERVFLKHHAAAVSVGADLLHGVSSP